MIGDPLYDYSRLMNFTKNVPYLEKFKMIYCPNIDQNIIHHIYTLRVVLNWFVYIKKHNFNYPLPNKEIKEILESIRFLEQK